MIPFTHLPPQIVVRCGRWSATGYGGARANAALAPQLTRPFSLLDLVEAPPNSTLVHSDVRHHRRASLGLLPNIPPAALKSP
jgi:hypothetical protein